MLKNIIASIKKNPDNPDFLYTESSGNENMVLLQPPSSDFIPYACHIDSNTVLAKNGHLIQVIKIVGFTFESLGGSGVSLRERVRKVILDNINTSDFAINLHTFRKKKNLDITQEHKNIFSKQLHKRYVEENKWNDKYINELFITIIYKGMPININSMNFLNMLRAGNLEKRHDAHIEIGKKKINEMASNIVHSLSEYSANRLEISYDENLGYHSGIVEFFANIIHLDESPALMKDHDISKDLSNFKIAFGSNTIQVQNCNKKFATILTLKNYSEIGESVIDQFLQEDQQFIVTQTLNFTESSHGKDKFEKQNYYLNISKDYELAKILELELYTANSANKGIASFFETQLTIMIIAESIEELDKQIVKSDNILKSIGLSFIREDINLEHAFWSQLPGNFQYINRKFLIPTKRIGGFASLHNFPSGSLRSKWGTYITILNTALGTPYFFNFHVNDNGHTIVVGSKSSGKGTLINFLISESLTTIKSLFYLDYENQSELFIKAIGGKYFSFKFSKNDLQVRMNPLLLPDNSANREFIKFWLLFLADKYLDPDAIEQFSMAAEAAVEVLYSLPKSERKLKNIKKFFTNPDHQEYNQYFIELTSKWYGRGKYSFIFDSDYDELIESENIIGFDITDLVKSSLSDSLPITTYLLHILRSKIDGSPAIFSVISSNRFFGNLYFEKNFEVILEDLKKSNCILLSGANFNSQEVNWSDKVADILQRKCATKIFLPDDSNYSDVQRLFKLSDKNILYLENLNQNARQFIINQFNISLVAELSLHNITTESKILSASSNFATRCFEIMVEYGTDHNIWVKQIFEEEEINRRNKEIQESIVK